MSEGNKATREGKIGGWIGFAATLLVVSYAAMPGHEAFLTLADRLNLVLALSVSILASTGTRRGRRLELVGVATGFYDE
jgi:hypothetical protein